ncbi:hypothetical protein ACJX0J_008323 [Zea mays]
MVVVICQIYGTNNVQLVPNSVGSLMQLMIIIWLGQLITCIFFTDTKQLRLEIERRCILCCHGFMNYMSQMPQLILEHNEDEEASSTMSHLLSSLVDLGHATLWKW